MRGGRKSERLRERDRSGQRGLEWMEATTIRSGGFGGGVEWVGGRWWPDQPARWRAWWSTACNRLLRSKLNLYSLVHGWRLEGEKKS